MPVGDVVSVAHGEQIALRSLCEVTAGPSGSRLDTLHDGPEGVPVISPPDLTDDHTVDTRRLRRVSESEAERLSRFALKEDDILLVRQGTLGRLALIEGGQATWLYNSSCLRLRPRLERIIPAYLASYLSYPPVQRYLLGRSLPGTVPSLNSAMLNELPVTVPPMNRQQAVVEVLADVDARIRSQRQLTDRLEALRPAIFGEMIQGTRSA
ncbi:restriction endonuclease subunit S [Streptomyces sp. WMMC500]|uniref:restriction endonuclease subunit S n=1 Tax=Streptomyces sp. WMMC500 TaxID=3015154 RepID=UPI00248D393F|nr:restriction endonuclease subunit S [Streptomyces sp. WMMC500]WBB58232.1 restriction endonuclease subunit S [Streptomyces sp. WMMC500]